MARYRSHYRIGFWRSARRIQIFSLLTGRGIGIKSGVDRVRIFGGRTALEVYRDYMINFHQELKDFFEDGTITEVEVGLGLCGELRYPSYAAANEYPDAAANDGWKYPGPGEFQVLNAAWDVGIPFASENALPCYGEDAYNKILEIARPNDPLGRHMSAFTYLRLCPELIEEENLTSFASFVSRMHGV